MSEENARGIRRVGQKDRKQKLDSAGPLIPEDLPIQPPAQQPESGAPASAEEIDAALRAVSELDQLAAIPFDDTDDSAPIADAEIEPAGAAVPEYDPDERFPPLKPQAAKPVTTPTATKPRRRFSAQDRIALFFFLATILFVVYFAIIWQNPYSPLNLLAPPTPFVVVTTTPLPTATAATPTTAPTASFTPLALAPNVTPSFLPFALADSGVLYVPNDNGRGCDWSSIAGTVTNLRGEPLDSYGVHISGSALDEKVFSGTAQTFGPGGFELFINGVPQQAKYTVQLFSPSGSPVSEAFTVTTSAECDQNVAIVNFVQVREL